MYWLSISYCLHSTLLCDHLHVTLFCIYKALHCGIINEATAPISIDLFIDCIAFIIIEVSMDQYHSIVYQSYPILYTNHCIVGLFDERTALLRIYIFKSIHSDCYLHESMSLWDLSKLPIYTKHCVVFCTMKRATPID